MNFQNWFVVFYFRWFFQRIQRINEINETNSTNQRIQFSLILENFNEFSTKKSTNQRKFSKNLRIRWNFVRNWSMLWKLPLISHDSLKVWWIYWNLRWKFVNIFTNQRKFYPLIRWIRWWIFKSIFIRWFRFSNQRIQRNQYLFFNENESTKKYFQQKNIFLELWSRSLTWVKILDSRTLWDKLLSFIRFWTSVKSILR